MLDLYVTWSDARNDVSAENVVAEKKRLTDLHFRRLQIIVLFSRFTVVLRAALSLGEILFGGLPCMPGAVARWTVRSLPGFRAVAACPQTN